MTLLRQRLLDGRAVALAGGVPPAVHAALVALGARVNDLPPGLDEDGVKEWAAGAAPMRALIYDAASAFAGGGEPGLQESLERAWIAIRGVATGALIPGGAGKILLIAPRADGGSFVAAARAALENLARTLSVEWARYAVTTVAIAPGARTSDKDLAELACFLISPAGEYSSGCVFELGGERSYARLSRPSRG
jgi:NAD(P)-dependent dehydrogenase (short-subunit alcohol dehydrogenase family)